MSNSSKKIKIVIKSSSGTRKKKEKIESFLPEKLFIYMFNKTTFPKNWIFIKRL